MSLSSRQRGEGVYGEVLWQPATWSIAFSSRYDHFGSFDAHQVGGIPKSAAGYQRDVFDPRLGVVKKINGDAIADSVGVSSVSRADDE